MTKKFENATEALNFMMAGKSTVTLKSGKTDNHFTYKISQAKGDNTDMYFVKVLMGSDNSWNGDWTYIGYIVPDTAGGFFIQSGRKGISNSPAFIAMHWTLNKLSTTGAIPEIVEIWHEGKCGKCGRKLTDPVSIETGLGPICRSA